MPLTNWCLPKDRIRLGHSHQACSRQSTGQGAASQAHPRNNPGNNPMGTHLGSAAACAREPQAACAWKQRQARVRYTPGREWYMSVWGCSVRPLGITPGGPERQAPSCLGGVASSTRADQRHCCTAKHNSSKPSPFGSFSSFSGVVRPCRCRPFCAYCSAANLRTCALQGRNG